MHLASQPICLLLLTRCQKADCNEDRRTVSKPPIREWLIDEGVTFAGYAAYVIPSAIAGFIALMLATQIAPMVGSQSIVVATILSGVIVGLCSLFLDQTLSRLSQLGRPAKY